MKINDRLFGFLLYLPSLILLSMLVIYPLSLLVFNSMFDYNLLHGEAKIFSGLENFTKALSSSRFVGAFQNTLIYAGIAVPIEFLIGLAMAILLNTGIRGAHVIRTVFLFPLMLAPVVVGLTWRFIFADQYGILNWVLYRLQLIKHPSDILWLSDANIALFSCVIADIWLTTPFMMLVLLAGLQTIPRQLLEAAEIDGASSLQVFVRVTLPLLRPVIAVVLIIRVVDALRTFDIVWTLTQGGPKFASEVVSTYIYRMLMRFLDVGFSSAMALIFLSVLLVVSIVFFFRIWKREA